MTNLHRFRRGLTNNPFCSICDQAHESVQHVLRDCPEANITWQAILAKGSGRLEANLNFKEWFLMNICDQGKDGNWPTKFLITMWYIWKWRNGVCFNATEQIPRDKVAFLLCKFDEVVEALRHEAKGQPRRGEHIAGLVSWTAPPEGWVVLNLSLIHI